MNILNTGDVHSCLGVTTSQFVKFNFIICSFRFGIIITVGFITFAVSTALDGLIVDR
jgi:hypothetical protein